MDWRAVGSLVESSSVDALEGEVLRLAVDLATENDRRRLYESAILAGDVVLRTELYATLARARS